MKQRQLMIIGGIAVVAVVLLAIIMATQMSGGLPSGSPFARYQDVPHTRLADGGFVLGNPDAPITIVEFGDFACPACQAYSSEMDRFIENYVIPGKAKFEYRMFMSSADPVYGPYTARLAECAAIQNEDAFWPAFDTLFGIGRSQVRFNDKTARTLADRLEISYSELLNCADTATQYTVDDRLGQSVGVSSTPTIMVRYGDSAPQFISDSIRTYQGGGVPYDVLTSLVDSLSPS